VTKLDDLVGYADPQRLLGKGGFGTVHRVTIKGDASGAEFALKRFRGSAEPDIKESADLEHKALANLETLIAQYHQTRAVIENAWTGHRNLLCALKVISDDEKVLNEPRRADAILFPLCTGNLSKLIDLFAAHADAQPLRDEDVMLIALETLQAVCLLQSGTPSWIHRDISLNNLLFHEREGSRRIVLADFGLCRPCDATDERYTAWIRSSEAHCPPEAETSVDDGTGKCFVNIGPAVDVWSAHARSHCC